MGCDIHMYAEVLEDGKWNKVGKVFKNPYYDPDDDSDFTDQLIDEPYCIRRYDLFAMLANVRNGYGVAGCDTGNGFKVISMPRGLPKDVSPEVKIEAIDWGLDGHSHSWLLLSEILEWDGWELATIKRGWVKPWEYQEFKEQGIPESWCGGAMGRGVELITNEEMEEIIEKKVKDGISYYTIVSWETPYKDRAGTFITETIPELKKLSQDDLFEDVRIVFWFDN